MKESSLSNIVYIESIIMIVASPEPVTSPLGSHEKAKYSRSVPRNTVSKLKTNCSLVDKELSVVSP